jgi:hypothetical protein
MTPPDRLVLRIEGDPSEPVTKGEWNHTITVFHKLYMEPIFEAIVVVHRHIKEEESLRSKIEGGVKTGKYLLWVILVLLLLVIVEHPISFLGKVLVSRLIGG